MPALPNIFKQANVFARGYNSSRSFLCPGGGIESLQIGIPSTLCHLKLYNYSFDDQVKLGINAEINFVKP